MYGIHAHKHTYRRTKESQRNKERNRLGAKKIYFNWAECVIDDKLRVYIHTQK